MGTNEVSSVRGRSDESRKNKHHICSSLSLRPGKQMVRSGSGRSEGFTCWRRCTSFTSLFDQMIRYICSCSWIWSSSARLVFGLFLSFLSALVSDLTLNKPLWSYMLHCLRGKLKKKSPDVFVLSLRSE